jgi:uncharacterized protein (TIGR02145 family)
MKRQPLLREILAVIIFIFIILAQAGCKEDLPAEDTRLKDFDGNVYTKVKIGSQEWMVQNLKTTHYRNGDAIQAVTGSAEWKELSAGAFCNYDNDGGLVSTYGRLYNWFAVADTRNLCPAGWHVSSKADWDTLMNYLGGYLFAGGKLKEKDTLHWTAPNNGATNEKGFTALPGGTRNYNSGQFLGFGSQGYFWTTDEQASDLNRAYRYFLTNQNESISSDPGDKNFGCSVRCIMD